MLILENDNAKIVKKQKMYEGNQQLYEDETCMKAKIVHV